MKFNKMVLLFFVFLLISDTFLEVSAARKSNKKIGNIFRTGKTIASRVRNSIANAGPAVKVIRDVVALIQEARTTGGEKAAAEVEAEIAAEIEAVAEEEAKAEAAAELVAE
nr:venom polypeptide precursor [Doratifera vulnerans]